MTASRILASLQIRITEHLGSGQFGTVNKGLWQSPACTVDVAVKTLKPGLGEDDRIKFLQEAAINGQFQHPNVVKLHGVVTVGEPVSTVPYKGICWPSLAYCLVVAKVKLCVCSYITLRSIIACCLLRSYLALWFYHVQL